ncbi:MAG TPA: AmmeMemoRadiSam system protein B [Bacteroidales bacterium]|nr:AmmeMemoRadiSam system protein B [Bacteroidales bacterium]
MKKTKLIPLLFFASLLCLPFLSCENKKSDKTNQESATLHIRQLVDTIGFAQYSWQMDSIVSRIANDDKIKTKNTCKLAICPHDDYAYAGGLYTKTLEQIKAKTVVLIGVAHKAKNFNLENKLVFDTFDAWNSAYGSIAISPLREKLLKKMPAESFLVNDSMMQLEHSLEAIIPFLQNKNRAVEIVPILIPYFSFDKMDSFSSDLAQVLLEIIKQENLHFGKDIAIVISNDAIHYGNEDWGGKNMAPFGVDSIGTAKVIEKEMEIINTCLVGTMTPEKIRSFNQYTVLETDFKEYKWTWCGRYAVPFGLMLGNKLNLLLETKPLIGTYIDYQSSLHTVHIEVQDLKMGTTAPAHQRHWVGYVGMNYN